MGCTGQFLSREHFVSSGCSVFWFDNQRYQKFNFKWKYIFKEKDGSPTDFTKILKLVYYWVEEFINKVSPRSMYKELVKFAGQHARIQYSTPAPSRTNFWDKLGTE